MVLQAPDRSDIILSGAKLAQFERFLHQSNPIKGWRINY